MSESTDAAAGGRRGGRTVSKSTPDEVMELACGLPLTRSVLRSVVADATPGQLGVLADLFRAENASRTESRRARLIRNAGFPCVKGFDGYDWGMASFPACFASMFVRQVRQCFSVVWADGFPRCRHRFPVM